MTRSRLPIVSLLFCFSAVNAIAQVPDWVVYPDAQWRVLSPKEAGIQDLGAWHLFKDPPQPTVAAKGE